MNKRFFLFLISDGKILVHNRRGHGRVELLGHNQEVNCLDARGGLIVSGSRDRTARVRYVDRPRRTDSP